MVGLSAFAVVVAVGLVGLEIDSGAEVVELATVGEVVVLRATTVTVFWVEVAGAGLLVEDFDALEDVGDDEVVSGDEVVGGDVEVLVGTDKVGSADSATDVRATVDVAAATGLAAAGSELQAVRVSVPTNTTAVNMLPGDVLPSDEKRDLTDRNRRSSGMALPFDKDRGGGTANDPRR